MSVFPLQVIGYTGSASQPGWRPRCAHAVVDVISSGDLDRAENRPGWTWERGLARALHPSGARSRWVRVRIGLSAWEAIGFCNRGVDAFSLDPPMDLRV